MKKLIYEVMLFALIISFTSNSFATRNGRGNGYNENRATTDYDKMVRQFSESDFDRLLNKDGVVSTEQLNALMKARAEKAAQNTNQPPVYVSVKESGVAKGVSIALNHGKALNLQGIPNESLKTSNHYGVVKDAESGVSFILNKTPKDQLKKMSPMNLAFHMKALGDATKLAAGPRGMTFFHEASTFYFGVGANHVFNLLTKYEKNPLALDMFVEELKDPIAQAGFFAFMVGNRYANILFQNMLASRGDFAGKKQLQRLLGFLAMGVGSVFSNVAHDLITLTKPCATALTHTHEEEYNSKEKVIAKCQEGWDAVMNSDNLARYVTSVMTVVVASIVSAVAQGALVGLASKTLPLDAIKVTLKKMTSAKGLAKAAKTGRTPMPGPVGLVIGTVNLVLFLQADELMHPGIHHLVESVGNSSPKLSNSKKSANLLLQRLETNKWEDVTETICKEATQHASQNRKDHLPAWIQNEMRVCTDGMAGLERFAEKNTKWRETLSYEFMNSYMNWVRYISEFQVMHDVSRQYFYELILYSHNRKADAESNTRAYNPLIMDNPLFGVNMTDKLQIDDMDDFKSVNILRAYRIIETIPMIDKLTKDLAKRNPNDEFIKPLIETKLLIEQHRNKYTGQTFQSYIENETERNYDSLVKVVTTINGLADRADRMVTIARNTRDKGSLPTEYIMTQTLQQKAAQIKAIKNYIGDPKPLKKGYEGFFEVFNDYVKKNFSEYEKLFKEKGSAAATITWYAVCGNPLGRGDSVVRRENTVSTAMDKGVNAITGGINSLTNWVAGKTNMSDKTRQSLQLRTDLAPGLRTFEAINFGTGIEFYTPKVVKHDMSRYCIEGSDGLDLYKILPGKHKPSELSTITTPSGQKYDSLFSYLINNIRDDVVNLQGDDGSKAPQFLEWWDKTVGPKVAEAYEGFMDDYSVLLNKTYRESLDGEIARNQVDMEKLADVIRAPRNKPWNNASNVVQSYADELNYYIGILDRIYTMSPQTLLTGEGVTVEQNQASKKTDLDIKLFKLKLANLRVAVYGLLNDFRNFNTEGSYLPKTVNGPNNVPVIVSSPITMDFHQKYAMILVELVNVYKSLGLADDFISAVAVNTPYFKKRDGMETLSPVQKAMARVQQDPAIGEHFKTFAENMDTSRKEPVALNYGLKEENLKLLTEGEGEDQKIKDVQLVNFKGNDRLAVSFLVSNNLFNLAEAIYKDMSVLNLAKMDNDYKNINQPEQKRQSSPFNR